MQVVAARGGAPSSLRTWSGSSTGPLAGTATRPKALAADFSGRRQSRQEGAFDLRAAEGVVGQDDPTVRAGEGSLGERLDRRCEPPTLQFGVDVRSGPGVGVAVGPVQAFAPTWSAAGRPEPALGSRQALCGCVVADAKLEPDRRRMFRDDVVDVRRNI